MYYREMIYPISNKGNPSFINLDIQRQFTENASKRDVNRFSSTSRDKKINIFGRWTIKHSDYRTFGLTFGLSDRRPLNREIVQSSQVML